MSRIHTLRIACQLYENSVEYLTLERAKGCALDHEGSPVMIISPTAVSFSWAGAVQRAIWDRTGEHWLKRQADHDAVMDTLHDAMASVKPSTHEETLKVMVDHLEKWKAVYG